MILIIFRFSFEITSYGEILKVYFPSDEDDHVLATKKGLASLLSAKLDIIEKVN